MSFDVNCTQKEKLILLKYFYVRERLILHLFLKQTPDEHKFIVIKHVIIFDDDKLYRL